MDVVAYVVVGINMLTNEIIEQIKEIKLEINSSKERIEQLEEWIEMYKINLKDKGFSDNEIDGMIK